MRRVKRRGDVLVLTFHRVLNDEEFDISSSLRGICVRQRSFEDFMAWAARTFEIVDLGSGPPDWKRPASRPRVALTFDDGWFDNYRFARPAVAQHDASITIFICPGLMGCAFPFWPERVCHLLASIPDHSRLADLFPDIPAGSLEEIKEAVVGQMKDMRAEARDELIARIAEFAGSPPVSTNREPMNRTMTWSEVRELHDSGVRIGSHTLSHPILTHIAPECVFGELRNARDQIEKRIPAPCRMFAYPNGSKSDHIRELVAQADYDLAFTTEPGFWTRNTNPFLVPRVNVWERKLTGPTGCFSPAVALYSLFWRK